MIAVFSYIAIALLYFHPLLSSRIIFIERDLSGFFLPPRLLWTSMMKSGAAPLWNPWNYSGIPLLATLQPGVFYPPHLLYFLLPFNVAWNWLIILHFVFAAFSVYLFLRYLNASWLASFVGGAVFMLSGYLLAVHNLITHLFAVPWFPLVLLSYLKYFDNRKRRNLVYSAVFLAMEFLAGAPEIVLGTVLVLAAFSVREVVLSWTRKKTFSDGGLDGRGLCLRTWKVIVPALIPIVLVVTLFVLVAAVQLIPFVELKLHSIRRSGLSYEEATTWSLAWRDFVLFLLPDAFGSISKFDYMKFWSDQSWLKTMYIGIIPIILSVFYFARNNRFRITFSVLAILSFLLALGGSTPFYRFLHYFPPFDSIRYPVKFLFPFFFVIAAMSGMGLDSLMNGVAGRDRRTKVLVEIIFYMGCFFMLLWAYVNVYESTAHRFIDHMGWKPEAFNDIDFNLHNLRRLLFFAWLFCMVLFFYLRLNRHRKTLLASLVLVLLSDLFLASFGFYNSLPWQTYMKPYGFADRLSQNSDAGGRYLLTLKTMKDLEVVFNRPPLDRMAFAPPYASLYRAYSMDGSEVMRIMHYDLFMQVLLFSPNLNYAKRFFNISDLKYLMTSYEIHDRDFAFSGKMTLNNKDIFLYEYLRRPGRFLLYSGATVVKSDKEAIEKLVDTRIDLTKDLIVLGDKEQFPGPPGDHGGRVELVSYGPNQMELEYEAGRNTLLYLSDTYYPGWRAYVDGRETKIYRANLAFRAIEVPEGRHTVVFRYVPMSVYIGLVLTLLGIGLCVCLWWSDRRNPHEIDDNGCVAALGSKGGDI
jgi:hypothetical protein